MYFPFYLSTRYLSSTRKGSFTRISSILSTAGLAVGVSALLITLFILNGFERVISEKISQFEEVLTNMDLIYDFYIFKFNNKINTYKIIWT